MMSFEVFKEVAKEKIKDYLPEQFQDFSVDIKTVKKVNREKVSMCIRDPKPEKSINPTIYIDDMYEQYRAGDDLGKVLTDAAHIYVTAYENPVMSSQNLGFDDAKEKVIMVLVNTEQNKELLKDVPHREFHDLSVVYRMVFGRDENGIMSSIVDNSVLKEIGMTEDELFQAAVVNTKEMFPAVIKPMSEIIMEMLIKDGMPRETAEMMMEELGQNETMWVLTNEIDVNGAVSMLYEENLHKVAEQLGDDLYVLPSSIHEVILVPASLGTPEQMADMVQEANMSVVSLGDRLSNDVYHYDKDIRKLTMATDTPNKRLDGIVAEMPLVYENEKKR